MGEDVTRACAHYAAQGSEQQGRAQAAFSGQLISDVADSLHLAVLSCVDAMRVVEPIYSCSLQSSELLHSQMLGKELFITPKPDGSRPN